MIEDKEIGLKIAENPEEAFWTKFKEEIEKRILEFHREIEINTHLIKLADEKLAKR